MIDIRDHGGSFGGSEKKIKYGWGKYDDLGFGGYSAANYNAGTETFGIAYPSTGKDYVLEARTDGDQIIISGANAYFHSTYIGFGTNQSKLPPILLSNGDILLVHMYNSQVRFIVFDGSTNYTTNTIIQVGYTTVNYGIALHNFFEFDNRLLFTIAGTPFRFYYYDMSSKTISAWADRIEPTYTSSSARWYMSSDKTYLYTSFNNYLYRVSTIDGSLISKIHAPSIMSGKIVISQNAGAVHKNGNWYIPFKKENAYSNIPTFYVIVDELSASIIGEIELNQNKLNSLIDNGMFSIMNVVDGRYVILCYDTGVWSYYNKAVIVDIETFEVIKKIKTTTNSTSGMAYPNSTTLLNDVMVINSQSSSRTVLELRIDKRKEFYI